MNINEKDVSRIWQEGRFRWLRDDAGNDIKVVFGGRPAVRPGCDFQDAVLEVNGERQCGDIELHVSSDLWKKHGHDRNPVYNNVILHVAMWEKGGLPAFMHGKAAVPTVILGTAASQFNACGQGCKYAGRLKNGQLAEILDWCGLERFYIKSKEFTAQIERDGAEQALYSGICRCLGYSRNKEPMVKLAKLLPLSCWNLVEGTSYSDKLALAMGIAGLIKTHNKSMSRDEWCFSGVRPANSPERRVAALCVLVDRLGTSWVGMFSDIIIEADAGKAAAAIEKKLSVSGDDGRKLIGKTRAREITVNSILPFLAAYGRETGDMVLCVKVLELYIKYPALTPNETESFMRMMLIKGGGWEVNACCQQGLLHIFNTYCRTRDCRRCPVSRRRRPGWG